MRKESLQLEPGKHQLEDHHEVCLGLFKRSWRKCSLHIQDLSSNQKCLSKIQTNEGTTFLQSPSSCFLRSKSIRKNTERFPSPKKHLVNQLIKYDTLVPHRISELNNENDEITLYSSDVYVNDEGTWKNRSIKSLTSKSIGSIDVENICKIKVKADQLFEGYHELRITLKDGKTKSLAIRKSCIVQWFSGSVWVCLMNKGFQSPLNQDMITQKSGTILKKSEIMGRWEFRYVKIDEKNGLQSGKIGQQPSLKIKQTPQLWTRLQKISNNKYLVIKLWNSLIKYQFSIPIQYCEQWLKAFCLLILKKR